MYSSQRKEEISCVERLVDYYCSTASIARDQSIEIFSLHGHLHLAYQSRIHGS